jgi:hypothetical protein
LVISKSIIWLRAFNEFISMFTSIWSLGMFIGPILLPLLITGFLGISAAIPLIPICAVLVVAIGLGVAAYTSYWRHDYLTKKANEVLSEYEVIFAEEVPDKINANQIIFQPTSGGSFTAYFKRLSNTASVDLRWTPEELALLNDKGLQKKGQLVNGELTPDQLIKDKLTPDQQAQLYGILQNTLSAEAVNSNAATDLSKSEKHIGGWEQINAFLSDSISAFVFVFVIIFLITHLAAGVVIPFALSIAIAVIVSLLYGWGSSKVKDRQVEVKLQQMRTLEADYDTLKTDVEAMRVNLGRWKDEAKQATTNLNVDDEDSLVDEVRQLADSIEKTVQKYQPKIVKLQQTLLNKKTTLRFDFDTRDKFRVGYAFFYGGSVMGSFLCTGFVAFLGLSSALAIPVVWIGVIVGVAVLYGAFHAYYKYQSIKREKWSVMKEDNITKLEADSDAVKAQEIKLKNKIKELSGKRDKLLQKEQTAKGHSIHLSQEDLNEEKDIIDFSPTPPSSPLKQFQDGFNGLWRKEPPLGTELRDMNNTPILTTGNNPNQL